VLGAALALGQVPQAGGGIETTVTLSRSRVGLRIAYEAAILSNEEKEEPVDQAQELTIVVLCGELARAQFGAQLGVGTMGQETTAEGFNGLLDPVP